MRQAYKHMNQKVVTRFHTCDDGDLHWDGTGDRSRWQVAAGSISYLGLTEFPDRLNLKEGES